MTFLSLFLSLRSAVVAFAPRFYLCQTNRRHTSCVLWDITAHHNAVTALHLSPLKEANSSSGQSGGAPFEALGLLTSKIMTPKSHEGKKKKKKRGFGGGERSRTPTPWIDELCRERSPRSDHFKWRKRQSKPRFVVSLACEWHRSTSQTIFNHLLINLSICVCRHSYISVIRPTKLPISSQTKQTVISHFLHFSA